MDSFLDALAGIIDPEEIGVIVTKATAVVEVIDSTGKRGLIRVESADLTHWESIGMLEAAAAESRLQWAMAAPQEIHGD